MYKLIAMDMDGTLLNSHKEISKANLSAVRYAIDKGIKVVVCSGRVYKGAKLFAKRIGASEIIIACNGAIIRDSSNDDIIYDSPLRKEDTIKLIDICHSEKIYFHAYVKDTIYTEKLDFGSDFYTKINDKLPIEERIEIKVVEDVGSIINEISEMASKIVVASDDAKLLLKVRKKAETIKSVEVLSSFSNNFEVMNHGVSKANALEFILKRYGISSDEVIAIGDSENDYSMIKMAGLGIVMENGEESLKKIADYIAPCNDKDGVAQAIKRFIL
jgi:Cof subfamily protein (haloacid dehalogenase superfamily)